MANKRVGRSAFVAALLLSPALPAEDPLHVPLLIPHQGWLFDQDDVPITGAVEIRFAIHTQFQDDVNQDSAIWSAVYTVQAGRGFYSVLIGDAPATTPLSPSLFTGQRWLGVRVGGANAPDMLPRMKIGSTISALIAERARSADSAATAVRATDADHADVAGDLVCDDGPCVDASDLKPGLIGDAAISSLDGSKIAAASLPWDRLETLAAPLKIANLDADRLDGMDSTAFAAATHAHAGEQITGGTVAYARLPESELDARYLNAAGDTATGALTVNGLLTAAGGLNVTGALNLNGSPLEVKPPAGTFAAFNCTGQEGKIFYDAAAFVLFGCFDGIATRIAGKPRVGETPARPGLSCKDIRDQGGSRGDGVYYINPGGTTVAVFCDMGTSGGGWTYGAIVRTTTSNQNRTRLLGLTPFGTAVEPADANEYSVNLTGAQFTSVMIKNFTTGTAYTKSAASTVTWDATTYTSSSNSQIAKVVAPLDTTFEFRTGYYTDNNVYMPVCFSLTSISRGWVCDADNTDILGMIDLSGGEGCNQGNWSGYSRKWQDASGACIDYRTDVAVYGFAVR